MMMIMIMMVMMKFPDDDDAATTTTAAAAGELLNPEVMPSTAQRPEAKTYIEFDCNYVLP